MSRLRFFLLIVFAFNVFALSRASAQVFALPTDSSALTLRNFDADALKNYQHSKDFHYGESQVDMSPTLWDKFWNWFWNLFSKTVTGAPEASFLKYVFIALGVAALIFLIIKLTGMDLTHLFTGKSKEVEIPYRESLENIHHISFDEEINNALNNKDFRLAVRLLYLKSLKTLNSRGRIKWEPDKTNTSYIHELKDPKTRAQFRQLTQRFEYVWYGSFNVDSVLYEKISRSFHEFNLSA